MAKDQATILAEHGTMEAELVLLRPQIATLTGDKTKLVAGATLPTDLVSAACSISTLTGERDTARAEVTKLTGDKTKLVAAATLPTDLTAAANEIQRLTAENNQMKSEKTTLEQAVATKLATLGITSEAKPAAAAANKKVAAYDVDAEILKARGAANLTELHEKMEAKRAAQNV